MPALVTALSLAFVWNYGDTYYTGYFHPGGPYIASQLSRVFFSADIPADAGEYQPLVRDPLYDRVHL